MNKIKIYENEGSNIEETIERIYEDMVGEIIENEDENGN